MKVLSLGELLWDVFPDRRVWGGAPANFTFHASQFGADSAMVSALGQDELGVELRTSVERVGIKLLAQEVAYPTGISKISVDQNGNPKYDIVQPSAWDYIQISEEVHDWASQADLICFGTLAQRHAVSRKTIMEIIASKKTEAKVLFDVNLRQAYYSEEIIKQSLEVSNFLKLNEFEVEELTKIFSLNVHELLETYNLDMIILTLGEKGSQVITADQRLSCPVYPCNVVDAVGAGDSFGAALIMQVLNGCDLKKAQELAAKVASYVCEHPGATVTLPNSLTTSIQELISHE